MVVPIIMLACFLAFTACGKSSSEVIQWKLATNLPSEGGGPSDWMKQYAEVVKEKTGGRLVITPYWSETLGKFSDELNMIQKGICDINYVTVGVHAAEFPLGTVGDVPFMMPTDRSLPFLNQIFDKYFKKDFKGIHVLFPVWIEGHDFYTKKKPFKTLSDMKGLQIAVPPSPHFVGVVKALGATPVDIPPSEMYGSLERGMVDGGMGGISILIAQKFYEQTKYFTVGELDNGFGVVGVNEESWNKLPDDLKKIIEDLNESQQQKFEKIFQDYIKACESVLTSAGITIDRLSPQDKAKFKAATKPIADAWEKDMIKKGHPEVADLRKDLAKYNSEK